MLQHVEPRAVDSLSLAIAKGLVKELGGSRIGQDVGRLELNALTLVQRLLQPRFLLISHQLVRLIEEAIGRVHIRVAVLELLLEDLGHGPLNLEGLADATDALIQGLNLHLLGLLGDLAGVLVTSKIKLCLQLLALSLDF